MSQEELADKTGVSRQAVSKWESAQSAPDLEKIIIMSDFFGVSTETNIDIYPLIIEAGIKEMPIILSQST